MALQDADNFIVSDASGTNYKINSTSLAAYVNAQASGGATGGFGSPGEPIMTLAFTVGGPPSHGDSAGSAQRADAVPTANGSGCNPNGKNVCNGFGEDAGALLCYSLPQEIAQGKQFSVGFAQIAKDDQFYQDGRVDVTCSGGAWTFIRGLQVPGGTPFYDSRSVTSIDFSGLWLWGGSRAVYPNLTTLRGTGRVSGVSGLTALTTVDLSVKIASCEGGDYDFRETALSAKTIALWLANLKLESEEYTGKYFKTLRFDGGTAATYEDLPQAAKDRITELQGLGYTIVMNGTGDASTVNVAAGNLALIIESSDGRYVPVQASTSAAIFPPTNNAAVVQYSTLELAKTAMDSFVTNFDSTRLFGELQLPNSSESELLQDEVEVNIGDAVTLDATPSINPDSCTFSYSWFKDSDDGYVAIAGATDATIQTASITSDQLGLYKCEVKLTHTSSGRSRVFTKQFLVEEVSTISPAIFIGSGSVDSVAVLAGGTGYSDATNVAVTGGSGTDLTVDITTSGGVVTAATVNFPGEGYVDGENVTITGGNADATIDVTVG